MIRIIAVCVAFVPLFFTFYKLATLPPYNEFYPDSVSYLTFDLYLGVLTTVLTFFVFAIMVIISAHFALNTDVQKTSTINT